MSGGGGGGGTRPPVTGSGADAPLPSGRGGGTSSIPNPRTGVPAPNQVTGAGFERLLNQLRTGVDANRGLLGKAARYGPGSVRTLEEFGKGNYLEALGSVARYGCCWGRRKSTGRRHSDYYSPWHAC
jgi:hypothetical protein